MSSADATASGMAYEVVTVNGSPPTSLEQFTGPASFVVRKVNQDSTVSGVGALRDAEIRFHEKSAGGDGKDVRVWSVQLLSSGGCIATTVATSAS